MCRFWGTARSTNCNRGERLARAVFGVWGLRRGAASPQRPPVLAGRRPYGGSQRRGQRRPEAAA